MGSRRNLLQAGVGSLALLPSLGGSAPAPTDPRQPIRSATGPYRLSAVGAAARTVLDKLDDLPLVTDFAGVDPSGATDSTAGLQALVAWAKTFASVQREPTFLVPGGDYKISRWDLQGASRMTFQALGHVNFYGTAVRGTAIINVDGGTATQTNKLNFQGNFTVQVAPGASYQYGVYLSYLCNSRWTMSVSGGFTTNSVYIDFSWDNPQLDFYATNSSGLAIATIRCGTNNVNNNRFYCRTSGSPDMAVASIGMELNGSGNIVQGDFSSSQIGILLAATRGCVIGPIYTEVTKHPISTSHNARGTKIQGGEVEVGTNGSIYLGSSENTSVSGLRIKGIGGGSNRTAIDMGPACYGLHTDGLSIVAATIDRPYAGVWRGEGGSAKPFSVGGYQWLAWPTVQVPASHPNTLDDYEKGTGTLSLTCASPGNMAVAAYRQRSYSYTKVGRDVTLHFDIVIAPGDFTHSTAGGAMRIGGIPFPAGATAARGSLDFTGISKAGYTNFTVHIGASGTFFELYASGSGRPMSTVSAADMPSGGNIELHGSIAYQAAN